MNKSGNSGKLRACLFFVLAFACLLPASAQRVGLKTNALYWAAASPNLGVEFRVNRHLTFNFEGTFNRLDVGKIDSRVMMFTPELRYWFSARPQAGHFVGLSALGADYNIVWNGTRHKGDGFGAGITYGYSFVLSRHWSLETTLGVGNVYRHEKSYAKDAAEPEAVNVRKWQWAPVKAGVSFVYIIK